MKFILIILFFLLSINNLFCFKIDFDGEYRNRFVYFINKDQDFLKTNDFFVLDLNFEIGLKIYKKNSLFYLYNKYKLGNLPWYDLIYLYPDYNNLFSYIKLENLYFAYKDNFFNNILKFYLNIGLFDFSTPSKNEYNDIITGIETKIKLSDFTFNSILSPILYSYSQTNSYELDDFEIIISNALLIYNNIEYSKKDFFELNLYLMNLFDNRYNFYSFINWAGNYNKLNFKLNDFNIKINFGEIYNFGFVNISNTTIPINSYLLHSKLNFDFDIFNFYLKFTHTCGNKTNEINEIKQFQVLHNAGKLDNNMGILFGGSSFNQQSYFDNEISTIYRKNLTTGVITFKDPGLTIIELGINFIYLFYELIFNTGIAFTTESINYKNFLGLEFDFHNKFVISNSIDIFIYFGILFPGNCLRDAYNLNHSSIFLGSNPCFKIDGKISYKFKN